MNRRDFCRLVALTTAGAVLPEQITALEHVFSKSTEHLDPKRIVAIHEIMFGFSGVPHDTVARVEFLHKDTVLLSFAVNYRSSMRWVAVPSLVLFSEADQFHWRAEELSYGQLDLDGPKSCIPEFEGFIGWIDSDGRQQRTVFDKQHQRLTECSHV